MTARWSPISMAAALVAGLSVLAPGTLFPAQGQAPATPTTAGEQPTFRAGVRLATVDAVVTDDKAHHVTDLTPTDFEVVERGHRQTVRQVIYVRTGPGARSAPTAGGVVAGGAATAPAPPAPGP
jgi:hypothetical protein